MHWRQRGDVRLQIIFLSHNSCLRQWHVYKEEIKFSYEVLPAWRRRIGKYNALLNSGASDELRRGTAGRALVRRRCPRGFVAGCIVGGALRRAPASVGGKYRPRYSPRASLS